MVRLVWIIRPGEVPLGLHGRSWRNPLNPAFIG